ncbi:CaiB/BaiF CoA-transferase family protein [Nocardioides sp. cx-173]|uniref:CaiB/BaiF CoA transferase family protein n=1 Tax=Nocardioides sp. cx-173 TaxID=2898796 RepID=UPI001E5FC706|nr:CoA transferase [Nocardioides sp. cx-173]MCD4524406.1 CoA transferase [Nocardioides sp. cx-173]UGB43106.1 CoA transferase [Nocardioides sp. cx-173]
MTNAATGPLAGVRVIEAGQLLAGPFAGQLMGDMGADVIKVEPPGVGDPMRQWGREKSEGSSLWWPVVGRNKRSVTLNLREAPGQRIFERLVAEADIVVENFRPGTFEKWNLGYDRLRELNPRLVLVRVSGYGQTGPYSSRAGYGSIGEAMGGLRYITGEPDRQPSRTGISIGDALAAMHATIGALAALRHRDVTGQGQVVDSAIYESVLAMMESTVTEWDVQGYQRERTGAVLPNVAPSNVYPTADGQLILIAANQDSVFRRLAALMDEPELAEPGSRYADHSGRGERQQELDDHIAIWTAKHDSDALLALLHEGGVPAGRIFKAADMLSDPHFQARDAIVRVPDARFGELAMQNVVPKLSATPGSIRWTGPELGQHNDEVYGDLLGLAPEERSALAADGVI